MEKSEIFLNHYNKIDVFLKKQNDTNYVPFSQKVKSSENKVVKQFKDELLSLAELRNAIIHYPKIGNQAIAEPHEETVTRIIELYNEITKPKKVDSEFLFNVFGAKKDDFINDILIEMRRQSFSQFPIFDDKERVCEVVSTNTISRWLSTNLDQNGTILMENIKVGDLITEIESEHNYEFIARDTSIYEAYGIFIDKINTKKQKLDALFITNSGKANEKLLGLITIEDIADKFKIYKNDYFFYYIYIIAFATTKETRSVSDSVSQ